MQLTENFSSSELACPCCRQVKVRQISVERLQLVRYGYGKPMGIAEGGGYRCPIYSGSETSAHGDNDGKGCQAFDPLIPKEDLFQVIFLAMNAGFKGIGVKNKGGRWQLHLDDADEIPGVRPRPTIWTY